MRQIPTEKGDTKADTKNTGYKRKVNERPKGYDPRSPYFRDPLRSPIRRVI